MQTHQQAASGKDGWTLSSVARAVDRISVAANFVGALAVLGMVLLVTYDVFMRRVFTKPTLFADDYSAYMLVALTFLGLGYALKENAHVRIDLVTSRLGSRVRRVLDVATSIIGLVFVVFLLKAVTGVFWSSYTLKVTSFGGVLTPLYIPQAFIVIGMAALVLQLAVYVLRQSGLIRDAARQDAVRPSLDR